jgi:hypothetical protein
VGAGACREVVRDIEKFKVEIRNINSPLDKSEFMCYNLDQVGKEIKLGLVFSTGKDGTMSLALESQRRTAALRRSGHEAPQVQDNGLDSAYRAACARRECDRRLYLARRRNLTNPVLNSTAL